MVNGWDGADPVQQDDGAGTVYELGERATVNGDLTITAIRVWHGASSNTVVGRKARIWTTGGVLTTDVTLTDTLPSGWTTFDLAAPLELTAGTQFVVSYSTRQFYGATAGGYPNDSGDGLLTYNDGRFVEATGSFPNTTTSTFYGVDVVYTPGIGGNVAPEITVAVSTSQLTATATVTVDDEAPGSVTYLYLWGDGASTSSSSTTANHTYAAPGVYPLMVVATDSGGLKGYAAAVVIVRSDTELFDLTEIIPEIAARLETIPGLQVSTYGPRGKTIVTPHAIVTLPTEPVLYHETYRQGGPAASATIPVVVALSQSHAVDAYELMAELLSSGGTRSIRAVIESGVFTHCDDPTVDDGRPDEMPIAGVPYLVVIFNVSVAK